MSESGFKKLLEFSDRAIREELKEDYYFISASRMNNYLDCLEAGAKRILELESLCEELRQRMISNDNEAELYLDALERIKAVPCAPEIVHEICKQALSEVQG